MKKRMIIACLCVSVLSIVSCGEWETSIPVEDYVIFLEEHKSILEEKNLIGWSAESRIDENEGYILMYNYFDPTLGKSEELKYMNYHELSSGKTLQCYGYTNDTVALCKKWDISTVEYSQYINSICKKIGTLILGYKIDKIQFYGNGNCFFSSTQNGWNLIYQKDLVLHDMKKQETELHCKGYSKIGESNFWTQIINRE